MAASFTLIVRNSVRKEGRPPTSKDITFSRWSRHLPGQLRNMSLKTALQNLKSSSPKFSWFSIPVVVHCVCMCVLVISARCPLSGFMKNLKPCQRFPIGIRTASEWWDKVGGVGGRNAPVPGLLEYERRRIVSTFCQRTVGGPAGNWVRQKQSLFSFYGALCCRIRAVRIAKMFKSAIFHIFLTFLMIKIYNSVIFSADLVKI